MTAEVGVMRFSRVFLGGLSGLAVVALAGCGTDTKPASITIKSPSAVLTATAAATENAGSYRTAATMTFVLPGKEGLLTGGAMPMDSPEG